MGFAESIEAGCGFLLAQQGADGLWADPAHRAATGSPWVTGQVGRGALATLPFVAGGALRDGLQAAGRALLQAQRGNGGWGFDAESSTDAESTAWALVFLQQHELGTARGNRAQHYLYWHWQRTSGGFTRYALPDEAAGRRSPSLGSSALPCVSAAVVQALVAGGSPGSGLDPACDYLKASQDSDGMWRSELWSTEAVPTALALTALMVAGRIDAAVCERATRGVRELMRREDVYEVAMGALGAIAVGLAEDLPIACARILAAQEPDGAWTAAHPSRPPSAYPTTEGATARRPAERLLPTVAALATLAVTQLVGGAGSAAARPTTAPA